MRAVLPREGYLLPSQQFLEPEQGSLELEQGFLEVVQRLSCSALSSATWREGSSIPYRSAVLLEGGPMPASAGWDMTLEICSTLSCGAQTAVGLAI
jgi:hypothetical protein